MRGLRHALVVLVPLIVIAACVGDSDDSSTTPASSSSSSGGVDEAGIPADSSSSSSGSSGSSGADGSCVDTTSDPANCGMCGKTCAQNETCKAGACVCEAPFTQCPSDAGPRCVDLASDGANCGQCGQPCDSKVCASAKCAKRIFVTSIAKDSNYGGRMAAHSFCGQRAIAANISGTYMAWLSTYNDQFKVFAEQGVDLAKANVPYVRIDQKMVATGSNDLLDGTLMNAINVDEFGTLVMGADIPVWTNTKADGTGFDTDDCNGWASSTGTARVGFADKTNSGWTDSQTDVGCSTSARLYCIEQ